MQTEAPRRSNKKVMIAALFALSMLLPGAMIGSFLQQNQDQATIQANQISNWTHPGTTAKSDNQSGHATIVEAVSLTVIHGTHDLFANQTLIKEGWTPDCMSLCFAGIKYAEDPTVHVTDKGIDFLQFKVHGACVTITCTKNDNATFLSVSATSGY